MANISALGVGSGLDLNGILSQLEAAEKQRLTPITNQQKTINSKISGFGQLKSALTKFNDATKILQKNDLYNNRSAVTNDSYLSAKVNSNAVLGDYSVKVDQLATAHSVATTAFTDKTESLGNSAETRKIIIEQANGDKLEVVLSKEETSLESIANAINHAKLTDSNNTISGSTINAAVIRSATDGYQLVITAKDTGEQQRITSIHSDDQNLNNIIGFDSNQSNNGMYTVATAQDAKCSINGIAVTSASNTIKDVISGVDLTLKSITTTPQNLTITTDNEQTKSAIKEWVAQFNELQSTISTLTKFTAKPVNSGEVDSSNGPLIGNSTLRRVNQDIRTIFSKGQSGEFSVLAEIGVNMDKDGVLTVDENKLNKVLNEKSDAVAELFIGDGEKTGIANEVVTKVNSFIDSNGLIDSATDSLNTTLKSLEKYSERVNDSIEQTIERYKNQFIQLDTLMSSMNNLSNYLTNQFDSMANMGKKK